MGTTLGTPVQYNFILRTLFHFLQDALPRKMKRMIFLSSLLAMIEDIKDPSDEIIKKLDELFKLADHKELSIGFPMYVHSFIWEKSVYSNLDIRDKSRSQFDQVINSKLKSKEFSELCEFFYNATPKWLRYGSKNLMENDLIILFKNMPELSI